MKKKKNDMENSKPNFCLKEMFICNYCRNICKGPCEFDLKRIDDGIIDDKNKDLVNEFGYHRKIRIDCLGKYCDRPCKYQNPDAVVDPEKLIEGIMFLGTELNKLVMKKED